MDFSSCHDSRFWMTSRRISVISSCTQVLSRQACDLEKRPSLVRVVATWWSNLSESYPTTHICRLASNLLGHHMQFLFMMSPPDRNSQYSHNVAVLLSRPQSAIRLRANWLRCSRSPRDGTLYRNLRRSRGVPYGLQQACGEPKP